MVAREDRCEPKDESRDDLWRSPASEKLLGLQVGAMNCSLSMGMARPFRICVNGIASVNNQAPTAPGERISTSCNRFLPTSSRMALLGMLLQSRYAAT